MKASGEGTGIFFEVVMSCFVTAVISVAAAYALIQWELGRLGNHQPLVLDFQRIVKSHYAKIQQDITAQAPEQAQEEALRHGEHLAQLLDSLTQRGYVILDRAHTVAYPQDIDITDSIAVQLGLKSLHKTN